MPAVDHIVLAAKDVERAKTAFEALTGVTPEYGGAHVGRGTCNYLVGLGGARYLEIIGLDPEQDTAALKGKISFSVDEMGNEAKLVSWAAATDELDSIAAAADWVGSPFSMRRATPSGKMLEWSLATSFGSADEKPKDNAQGLLPFFIDWRDTPLHPASTSPKGCRLVSLTLEHPQRSRLVDSLGPLGVLDDGVVTATEAPQARMIAVLDTPNGVVALSDLPLLLARARL